MPLRDFRCEDPECGHVETDQIVKADVDTMACPKCGKPMKKMVSLPVARYKGDGWTPYFGERNG